MKQLLPLVLCVILGCGVNVANQVVPLNIPVIDPNDPESIAKWESSPYNRVEAKIGVFQLEYLHGTLGNSSPKPMHSVAIQFCKTKSTGITHEQQAAVDYLIQNESIIHSTIREAVYTFYKESYPAYKQGEKLGAEMYGGTQMTNSILPIISLGSELDDKIQFGTIYVHPSENGTAAIGISLDVPWDEEHGIGLRLRGEILEEKGTAHVALPMP